MWASDTTGGVLFTVDGLVMVQGESIGLSPTTLLMSS
jgi:hypothetical protein